MKSVPAPAGPGGPGGPCSATPTSSITSLLSTSSVISLIRMSSVIDRFHPQDGRRTNITERVGELDHQLGCLVRNEKRGLVFLNSDRELSGLLIGPHDFDLTCRTESGHHSPPGHINRCPTFVAIREGKILLISPNDNQRSGADRG